MTLTIPLRPTELDQATHLLHRVGQCAADVFAHMTPAGTLTSRQFAVLAAIEADEGASQADLVEATGVDRSTLAEMIKRLIEKEMVERKRKSTDRRTYELRLSAHGRATLRQMRPFAEAANQRIEAAIPQRKVVLDALAKMVDELSQFRVE